MPTTNTVSLKVGDRRINTISVMYSSNALLHRSTPPTISREVFGFVDWAPHVACVGPYIALKGRPNATALRTLSLHFVRRRSFQQLRQLGDISCDSPRLDHSHLMRANTLRLIIAIGVGDRLPARIPDAPAARRAHDGPGWREATGHGRRTSAGTWREARMRPGEGATPGLSDQPPEPAPRREAGIDMGGASHADQQCNRSRLGSCRYQINSL